MSQCLLIDADDTLWENSIYFEEVIACVEQMLEPLGVTAEDFRACLNEMERCHIRVHGYGTRNFARSLVTAFDHFSTPGTDPALKSRVRDLAMNIMKQPVELLDGVPETLEYLARRHLLFLVTKGDPGEQGRKIENSGLKGFFQDVEILREKNILTFRGLLEARRWNPDSTWMIGNSPRSDINPALAAGMNAVYIPHRHTWILEHEPAEEHPRLLELEKFSDLRSNF